MARRRRSDHPDAGVDAIGARPEWITASHPFQYGYGPGTPLERILQADAQTDVGCAARHNYCFTVPSTRRAFRTSGFGATGASCLPSNCFELIAAGYLRTGGATGTVGQADRVLFPSKELVAFAIEWLERFFA